jgi:hypothetical protein
MNNWLHRLSGASTDPSSSNYSLLEAYQSEKNMNMNGMYGSQMIPNRQQPAMPNSAMFLAALQHEAARKAQLQKLFAYQGGLQASGVSGLSLSSSGLANVDSSLLATLQANRNSPAPTGQCSSSDAKLLPSKFGQASAPSSRSGKSALLSSSPANTQILHPALLSLMAAKANQTHTPQAQAPQASAFPNMPNMNFRNPLPSNGNTNHTLFDLIQQAKRNAVHDEAAAVSSLSSSANSARLAPSAPLQANATTSMNDVKDAPQKENSLPSSSSSFVEPQPNDVLFGKGRTKYRGNRNLQRLIENLMGVYEAATKQQKKELAEMAVSKIVSSGGRFLKVDEETQRWKEVTKEEAHKKVAHAFRNLRRRNK